MAEWAHSPKERLATLFCYFAGTLTEYITDPSRNITKKFRSACSRIVKEILEIEGIGSLSPKILIRANPQGRELEALHVCPFCDSEPGSRSVDGYFTAWNKACYVQMGNLLYETGLVLWGHLLNLPDWATGETLSALNKLRHSLRKAGKDGSFLECPQCGRLGTHLYGGREAGQQGFCRWCLDMGGGLPLAFNIELDERGKPDIQMLPCDYSGPAKNAWDILPPEILSKKQD
ncbi:MAG: hypothetical protein K9M54_06170 [Kiritimatiellales bacterium]|nr:hypothetical protein [Kiritimatiellales bacterium]MCF7864387.1 hypothetical protein [Kiritimatiellales bacterium]